MTPELLKWLFIRGVMTLRITTRYDDWRVMTLQLSTYKTITGVMTLFPLSHNRVLRVMTLSKKRHTSIIAIGFDNLNNVIVFQWINANKKLF